MRSLWIAFVASLLVTAGVTQAQGEAEPGLQERSGTKAEYHKRIDELRKRYREASPEQRRAFRDERLRVIEAFRRRGQRRGVHPWTQLDPDQREQLREEFKNLQPSERREFRRKLRDYHALSDSERAELNQRFEVLRSLKLDEGSQIEHNAERWKRMDPEQRDKLRETWRRFKTLPLGRQQELLDRALLDDQASGH